MAAVRAVLGFNVFEDHLPEFCAGGLGLGVEGLALQGCEEALSECVVVDGADAAHAPEEACLAGAMSEGSGHWVP